MAPKKVVYMGGDNSMCVVALKAFQEDKMWRKSSGADYLDPV